MATAPEMWLLGSSTFSANLAATLGMPYVYANHFGQTGIREALDIYRTQFQPSESSASPRTLVTASVSLAETTEDAALLALPQALMIARSHTGGRATPQLTIDDAQQVELTPAEQHSVNEQSRRWMIGTAPEVEERIRSIAEEYDVDEVMVLPVGGAYATDAIDATPARVRALELLATRFPELSRPATPADRVESTAT